MVLISILEFIRNYVKVDWLFVGIFLSSCFKSIFINILGYYILFYFICIEIFSKIRYSDVNSVLLLFFSNDSFLLNLMITYFFIFY